MMTFVSLVYLMSAQMLVWGSLSEINEGKALRKAQLIDKLSNVIEERKALISKLEKK